MKSAMVSVEQGLLLIQMLAQYKTENTKLRLRVREQEIQIRHMESVMVPKVVEKVVKMSPRPEATPEKVIINNTQSSLSSQDNKGVHKQLYPDGHDMLEQIMAVESMEFRHKMGKSMRQKPLAPLIYANNQLDTKTRRSSVKEFKGPSKKCELLEVIQEMQTDNSDRPRNNSEGILDKKQEKLEDEQLLTLLTESLKKLPI